MSARTFSPFRLRRTTINDLDRKTARRRKTHRSGREARIQRPDLVHVGREPLGEGRVVELEYVLRVLLARAREVEAADEDDVVGDGDLGVHEVVRRPLRLPRSRRLPGEG